MHQPAPDAQPAGDGPWEEERRARSVRVSADERDTRAEAAGQRATDRDTAAGARDDAAARLLDGARVREELACQRIQEMTERLNALDVGEADQHLHSSRRARRSRRRSTPAWTSRWRACCDRCSGCWTSSSPT